MASHIFPSHLLTIVCEREAKCDAILKTIVNGANYINLLVTRSMARCKQLTNDMDKRRKENELIMNDLVKEVTDMNKEYYEKQLASLEERMRLEVSYICKL